MSQDPRKPYQLIIKQHEVFDADTKELLQPDSSEPTEYFTTHPDNNPQFEADLQAKLAEEDLVYPFEITSTMIRPVGEINPNIITRIDNPNAFVRLMSNDGRENPVRIYAVDKNNERMPFDDAIICLDFNHAYAGKNIVSRVTVVSCTEAQPQIVESITAHKQALLQADLDAAMTAETATATATATTPVPAEPKAKKSQTTPAPVESSDEKKLPDSPK